MDNETLHDLLYLQAERCDLEDNFNIQALSDSNDPGERFGWHDREWWHLSERHSSQQGEVVGACSPIRQKLREILQGLGQPSEPSQAQRSIVHSFAFCRSLGGDCGFLGRDLSDQPNNAPSIYSGYDKQDLVFLGEASSEDDCLITLLLGPGLTAFNRSWKYFKKPALRDEEAPATETYQTPR